MFRSEPKFSRRHLLQAGSVGAAAFGLSRFAMAGEGADEYLPVRTVTHGPKYHWFGYYDKLQFDPTQRYLLGMEVDFENRSPRADDTIRIGMVDLQDGDRWIELG